MFDLDFVDDMAMIGTKNSQLQDCTAEMKENEGKVGLKFDNKKCEVMCSPGENNKHTFGPRAYKNNKYILFFWRTKSTKTEVQSRKGKSAYEKQMQHFVKSHT